MDLDLGPDQGSGPARQEQQRLSILYSDESGNTGPRLLPSDQPIFVLAFVELEQQQELLLKKALEEIRTQIRLADSEEFKFKRLVRGSEGLLAIRKIGEAMAQIQAPIHFAIVEKRYYACHLVTETFFDDAYNPYAPPEEVADGFRRWVANKIYESCDNGILGSFVQAALGHDTRRVLEIGRTIASRMRFHPDDRVVKAVRIMEHGLKTPFSWERRIDGPPTPTPMFSVFSVLLSHLNKRMEIEGRYAEIVADKDMQFGATLDEVLKICRDPNTFPDGWSPYGVEGPFSNILQRREANSESSMGIQLADVAAGMICRVALRCLDEQPMSDEFLAAWSSLKRAAIDQLAYWQVSEERLKKMLVPFRGMAPRLDPY